MGNFSFFFVVCLFLFKIFRKILSGSTIGVKQVESRSSPTKKDDKRFVDYYICDWCFHPYPTPILFAFYVCCINSSACDFRLDLIMESNTKEQFDQGPYCLQCRLPKNINRQENRRQDKSKFTKTHMLNCDVIFLVNL